MGHREKSVNNPLPILMSYHAELIRHGVAESLGSAMDFMFFQLGYRTPQKAEIKNLDQHEARCWAAGISAWIAICVTVILFILWLFITR